MNTFWHDLRYGLRMLLKNPGFTAVAVIALALGIGANSAVFSVVNAVLLRPLPFHNPDRLVALLPYDLKLGIEKGFDQSAVCYPDFTDWRAQNRVFDRMAVYTNESLTLTDGQEAIQVQGQAVSADLFAVLGVQPIVGRAFLPKEDEPGSR